MEGGATRNWVLFEIAAAPAFGGGAALNRVGMRHWADDNGVRMTVFVTVVVLGVAMLFVPMPASDPRGIVAFNGVGFLEPSSGGQPTFKP